MYVNNFLKTCFKIQLTKYILSQISKKSQKYIFPMSTKAIVICRFLKFTHIYAISCLSKRENEGPSTATEGGTKHCTLPKRITKNIIWKSYYCTNDFKSKYI